MPATNDAEAVPSTQLIDAVEVAASISGWLPVSQPFTAGLSIAPSLHLGRLQLGLELGSALSSSSAVTLAGEARGTLNTRPLLLSGSGGACFGERLRFCAAGLVGARLSVGWTEGDRLYSKTTAVLARPALGGRLELRFRLAGPLGLRAFALASAPLGGATFALEGIDATQASLAPVDLIAGLGLSLRFDLVR